MSFTIRNKLSFIDRFQYLNSSLDSLVKDLNRDDFKYLKQEFDKNELDQVKQKVFCPDEYMTDHEKCKEKLPNKEYFYSFLTGKKNSNKEYGHILNVLTACT